MVGVGKPIDSGFCSLQSPISMWYSGKESDCLTLSSGPFDEDGVLRRTAVAHGRGHLSGSAASAGVYKVGVVLVQHGVQDLFDLSVEVL